MTTLASPGGSVSVYATPLAVDGPELLYVTVPLTVLPAAALAGTLTATVTSATAEIAVVSVAAFGRTFKPSLVDVAIALLMATEPLAGATNVTPSVIADPAPRLVGMLLSVTAPVAGS